MIRRNQLLMVGGAVIAVACLGVASVAAAGAVTDDDKPITGDALQRASAAALAHTGQGRVTETEVGDEDSYYEVEVTLDDGHQVDVQLDQSFNVVQTIADHEDRSDTGGDR